MDVFQNQVHPQLAVYSTFCGTTNNKTFHEKPVESEYKHFFISNNQDVLSIAMNLGWEPLFIDLEVSDNLVLSAHQAKIAKAIPHRFQQLNEFEFTFYKDDKIDVDLEKIISHIPILQENNSPLAIRPHLFLAGNNLFEFGEAMLQARYKAQWAQTVRYITEQIANGYNLECQMYWTSAILRNMRHPDIQLFNETWFENIQRCGIECQISFNFVAQKFPSISLLPLDIR